MGSRAAARVGNKERGDLAIAACHRARAKAQSALHDFSAAYVVFSHRERELLRRIAQDPADIKSLADSLEISPVTAAAHVRGLCRKAGVENAAQLVVYAMQQPHAIRQPKASCKRGIHIVDPACPCPHCRAILAA